MNKKQVAVLFLLLIIIFPLSSCGAKPKSDFERTIDWMNDATDAVERERLERTGGGSLDHYLEENMKKYWENDEDDEVDYDWSYDEAADDEDEDSDSDEATNDEDDSYYLED